MQIVTRGATGRNARSTLALLDGRSIYQDYFGMVLWDLLPVGLDDVKQVEVARGPGSAIWGANALTGAINIITKSPREMLGTRATVGIGERDTREAAISHAARIGQARLQAERLVPTRRRGGIVRRPRPMARRCRPTRAWARRRTRPTFASISIRAIARNGASMPVSRAAMA